MSKAVLLILFLRNGAPVPPARDPIARLDMTLRPRLSDPYQYYLPVRCTNCAATGKIFWEGVGEQKTLVRLSNEFYERLGRLPPHPIEIVCRTCGTTQLE